ncbi:hypothetical protein ACFCV3_29560 [Kribbella sp. NPDC056345]|uniref:hypothetical protein n=1 Tax=Kribbella sp. NPDC056345 TaxID=3345789 RepID=UPI0035D8607F
MTAKRTGRRSMLSEDLSDYLFARSSGHFASLMSLIGRGCYRAIKTGTETLTVDLLDAVRIDQAAETARKHLAAAIDAGLLTYQSWAVSGPPVNYWSTTTLPNRQLEGLPTGVAIRWRW